MGTIFRSEDSPCPDDYFYQYKEALRDIDVLSSSLNKRTSELEGLRRLVKQYICTADNNERLDLLDALKLAVEKC